MVVGGIVPRGVELQTERIALDRILRVLDRDSEIATLCGLVGSVLVMGGGTADARLAVGSFRRVHVLGIDEPLNAAVAGKTAWHDDLLRTIRVPDASRACPTPTQPKQRL